MLLPDVFRAVVDAIEKQHSSWESPHELSVRRRESHQPMTIEAPGVWCPEWPWDHSERVEDDQD